MHPITTYRNLWVSFSKSLLPHPNSLLNGRHGIVKLACSQVRNSNIVKSSTNTMMLLAVRF